MPVLVSSYKPRSIHTPHPCRIASMAESALDGSALGRVRGVTPLFLSQQLILGTFHCAPFGNFLCPFWKLERLSDRWERFSEFRCTTLC